jgi:phosphatidylglycerol:prolipoprotein diacylglycerol transferase
MSYSTGVVPTPPGITVFPTPLYESVLCLLIAGLLFSMEKKPAWQMRPVGLFSLGVLLLAVERFAIEFLRINPRLLGELSQAQLIAIVIGVSSGALFLYHVMTLRRSAT